MQNYAIFHFPFNFTASSHCMFALRLPSALYRKSGESLLWFYLLLNFTLVPPAARSPPAAPCPRGPPFTRDLRAACPGRGLSARPPSLPPGPAAPGRPAASTASTQPAASRQRHSPSPSPVAAMSRGRAGGLHPGAGSLWGAGAVVEAAPEPGPPRTVAPSPRAAPGLGL